MTQINNSYGQKHVQVTNAGFTNITIPINCNKIIIRNGNESGGIVVRISTDDADAEAYDLIDAGDSRLLEPADRGGSGVVSFRSGDVLCRAKSNTAGTTDLFFTFLQ
jgi:hypothetical protein